MKSKSNNCCRWDNSLLWGPPTESSFMGHIVSSGLHHFRFFFLHTKLSKDISGTGIFGFSKNLLWGMRTGTCCVFVYLLFLGNPLGVLGHIIHRWKDIHEEIAVPLES